MRIGALHTGSSHVLFPHTLFTYALHTRSSHTLSGFGAALGSNLFFAARSVLSTQVLRAGAVSAGTLYWLLCCIATVVTLPAAITLGQPYRLLGSGAGWPLLLELCVCGAAHFTYNMLSFQILQMCAPPTSYMHSLHSPYSSHQLDMLCTHLTT